MALDISKIQALGRALQKEDERFEALQSLNSLLESCPNQEILVICSLINPQQIFLLLDASESKSSEEILHVICSVISKMLFAFGGEEFAKMFQYIELGLQHDHEHVRKMTLQLLMNKISNQEVADMLTQPTMFHLITQLLGDDSLDCAKHSNNVIVSIIKLPNGATIISSLLKGFDIDLKGLLGKSAVVRYRVFDLVVAISCLDKVLFITMKDLGYFEKLISDLETDDILLKLNCLEVLEVLMESQHGCDYIHSSDVLNKLHLVLEMAGTDPLSGVLIPGILKFFGHFCKRSPTAALMICSKCPLFLDYVTSQVQTPQDDTVLGVAMETFGLLGSSAELRQILLLPGQSKIDKAVRRLWELALYSQSNLQVRALETLSAVFSCEVAENDMLSSEWFNVCPSQTPLSAIMDICRRPFTDLQHSGLRLILSISTWEWGQKQIKKCPGLVEYILDRKAISDKNGKQLKFQIASTLANSETSEVVFGGADFLKFKEYERNGPFFVVDTLSVAFEEV